MKYRKEIILKNGKSCILRNATANDVKEIQRIFIVTHEDTDYLLRYSDEKNMSEEEESKQLQEQEESETNVTIIPEVEGRVVGISSITRVGEKDKIKHRADFGIAIEKPYWGLGIGMALTEACIECAQIAEIEQLELIAVAENQKALNMYRNAGFIEYGRNPKAFKSRYSGYQEVVYMRLEL